MRIFRKWTTIDDCDLKEFVKNKTPYDKIAEALNRTKDSVSSRIRTLKKKTGNETYKPKNHKTQIVLDRVPTKAVNGILLSDIENGKCRYPIEGVGINLACCGKESKGTYCKEHHTLCHASYDTADD